jgi:hypothetical protein
MRPDPIIGWQTPSRGAPPLGASHLPRRGESEVSCVLASVAVAVMGCPTGTFVTSSFTPAVTGHGPP